MAAFKKIGRMFLAPGNSINVQLNWPDFSDQGSIVMLAETTVGFGRFDTTSIGKSYIAGPNHRPAVFYHATVTNNTVNQGSGSFGMTGQTIG